MILDFSTRQKPRNLCRYIDNSTEKTKRNISPLKWKSSLSGWSSSIK